MATFLTLEEAIAAEPQRTRRHALLGNGFSIACKPDIFTYGALLDRADFSELDAECRTAFGALATTSFERVMSAMTTAAALTALYVADRPEVADRLRVHAGQLKDVLVSAIANSHPEHPFEVTEESYSRARLFLSNFKNIYSLSYDLLLYWTLMREEIPPEIECDDGFRQPDDGEAEYVTWEVEKTDRQNIHYFHGALHLFDAGSELQKFTWSGTGVRLVEQIREALDRGLFPLIVTEGESEKKLTQINHHTYLSRVYRSFAKIGNALYVYGFSFSESDEHILRRIEKNNVRQLFVSIFGDPDSQGNRRIIARAEAIADRRPDHRPLRVAFFDAEDAHVW